MADDSLRSVSLSRLSEGVYRARNARGATLDFGSQIGDDGFSPVELLLAAIAGCSAVDVDVVTGRRAEAERFEVTMQGRYVRDDGGNILEDLVLTFDVAFGEGEAADKARELLPRAAKTSHDRTCTVSRTVEAGTPVTVRIAEET